jgi:hypothetical protein
MSYSQGGLIAATDYNNFLTGTNQLNTVWSTGTGNAGYGQTALATVSAGGTVTAAQWASLINALNSTLIHQSGSGSGLSTPTAGNTIAFQSTLATNINTAYTNRLNANSRGTTVTGSGFSANPTAANGAAYPETTVIQRSINFGSGDAARYFFNAGGRFSFVITGVSNNDGTSRSADMASMIGTGLGGVSNFSASGNSGITGSGSTVNTNNTGFGYYNLTSSWQLTHQLSTTSSTYSGDYAKVYFISNGTQGTNGDVGSQIQIALNIASSHATSFDDSMNITINYRIDITPPETTNLSNSWGSISIA